VVVFIFAIDGLSFGVWLALLFSVVALVLTVSVYRDEPR
jgi:heme exporter protein D